MDQVLEVSQ
jgi:hypothetical protein